MSEDYRQHVVRDLRLVILKELTHQPAYTLNEVILQKVAASFGHNRTRDAIRNELRYLADVGAVHLVEEAGYMIATLSRRGQDHVQGLAEIEGVARPTPKE